MKIINQDQINFHLPWNNHEDYWLCVVLPEEDKLHSLENDFKNGASKGIYVDNSCFAVPASKKWSGVWNEIFDSITKNSIVNPKIAIVPRNGTSKPSLDDISFNLYATDKVEKIADNLWLGDALMSDRIQCHFQVIVDRRGQPFGYESFARALSEAGETIGGNKIMEASKALNIEHMIDKYLQVLAIKSFSEGCLPGRLFINFMTGFIQRPEKYLEALTDAATHYNLIPKNLVLDVTNSNSLADVKQVKSIISFCHSKGYSVALDDVQNVETVKQVLAEIAPDFVKIDRNLSRNSGTPAKLQQIHEIVELSHKNGCYVLAEGIETEEVHMSLLKAGVDLFQGYFFSQAIPVEQIKKAC